MQGASQDQGLSPSYSIADPVRGASHSAGLRQESSGASGKARKCLKRNRTSAGGEGGRMLLWHLGAPRLDCGKLIGH